MANLPRVLHMCTWVASMDWGVVKVQMQPYTSGMSSQIEMSSWWEGGNGQAGSHRVCASQSRMSETFCLVARPHDFLWQDTRSLTREMDWEDKSFL